jgi:CubicO group peptidase (beta-lactamase class C family)
MTPESLHRSPRSPLVDLFALLFALLAVVPTAAQPPGSPTPAGRWEGEIATPGTALGVVVDLSQDAGGAWQGDVDIPLQGAKDLPLTGIAVDGAAVRFSIAGIPGEPTFAGTLSDDGATLAGDFTQGGATFPFTLGRAGEAAVADRITGEEALAGFDAWMAEQLAAWEVPGAAVAVVRDGEVVLAKGYGLRDVAAGLPATADTQFAIGSATKAFTATVLATLADEGELDWDEPVRTYLPDFALSEDVYSERVTPRDLVSHRTGLPRHDLVWYGSDLSRKELYERLRHLEPSEDLRAAWQYQNLMFMTAGHLAGEIAGSDWETLVRERIFAPLGMTGSNFSVDAMARTADHATGYEKTDEDDDGVDEIEPMPYRRIDAVGPAGSINSSAAEMARWVELQLGAGTVDGTRVISPSALAPLHQPLMVVPGGLFAALFKQPEMPYLMYGMGWFVQPYRGHEMVHHGGNIDGFSARVTFLPNDGLGVVVLTNLNGTSLPTVATLDLLDRFLGEEPADWSGRYLAITEQLEGAEDQAETVEDVGRRRDTAPSHPLAEYAGTYAHPAYGDVEVTLPGDGLHLAYHTLESALGHWHFDVFRASEEDLEGIKVSFENGLSGHVERLVVDLQPGVEAIRFDKLPPAELADPARLAEYAGDYELMGLTLTVGVRETEEGRGELTVAIPGQGVSALVPVRPDEFELADQEGYGMLFQRGDDGAVTGMVLIQPQGNMPAERKPATAAEKAAA